MEKWLGILHYIPFRSVTLHVRCVTLHYILNSGGNQDWPISLLFLSNKTFSPKFMGAGWTSNPPSVIGKQTRPAHQADLTENDEAMQARHSLPHRWRHPLSWTLHSEETQKHTKSRTRVKHTWLCGIPTNKNKIREKHNSYNVYHIHLNKINAPMKVTKVSVIHSFICLTFS